MTKTFYLYDRFFESNRNLTTEHVKIAKIPGFQVIKTLIIKTNLSIYLKL